MENFNNGTQCKYSHQDQVNYQRIGNISASTRQNANYYLSKELCLTKPASSKAKQSKNIQ